MSLVSQLKCNEIKVNNQNTPPFNPKLNPPKPIETIFRQVCDLHAVVEKENLCGENLVDYGVIVNAEQTIEGRKLFVVISLNEFRQIGQERIQKVDQLFDELLAKNQKGIVKIFPHDKVILTAFNDKVSINDVALMKLGQPAVLDYKLILDRDWKLVQIDESNYRKVSLQFDKAKASLTATDNSNCSVM